MTDKEKAFVDLDSNSESLFKGKSRDERIEILLNMAKEADFNIIPFKRNKFGEIDDVGRKEYNIWKIIDGEEYGSNPVLEGDNWIKGFEDVYFPIIEKA